MNLKLNKQFQQPLARQWVAMVAVGILSSSMLIAQEANPPKPEEQPQQTDQDEQVLKPEGKVAIGVGGDKEVIPIEPVPETEEDLGLEEPFETEEDLGLEEPLEDVPETERDVATPLEQKILSKMHQKNQMAMKLGQLAMEKGASDDVKDYGRRMYRDHRFADRKVQNLAREEGIILAEQMVAGKKPQKNDLMQQLRKAEGEEFDGAYLRMVRKSHTQMINQLEQALTKLQDPEVSSFIERIIPILDQHRSLAAHLAGEETEELEFEARR